MSSSLIHAVLILGLISTALAGPIAKTSASSYNLFADQLFSVIAAERPSENVVYSPASIQTCLALAYIGADGETAQEMRSVLKLGEGDRRQVAQSYGEFLKTSFKSAKPDGPMLKMANRIYVDQSKQISDDFNKMTSDNFDAQAEIVNFQNGEDARNRINRWVEQQTENKIKDMVAPGAVDGDTSAVLVNAIYFKGRWQRTFEKEFTRKRNFQLSTKQQVSVDMMTQDDTFNYVELPEYDARALELPYENSDLSMLIILPNEVEGLKNLETKLKGVDLNDITSKMSQHDLIVDLPKFRIEFDIDLKKPLKKMGLTSMFSDSANFKNLFADASDQQVSSAMHKAFLAVDEDGSEAAAATYVKITPFSGPINQKKFNADHPFVFAIRSKTAVYFAGHVAKFYKETFREL